MTAHMYGCEMRCLVVELNISCVFGTDGEMFERARGLSGAGNSPRAAPLSASGIPVTEKIAGSEKSSKIAVVSTSKGVREVVRSVRLTYFRQPDKKPLTRPRGVGRMSGFRLGLSERGSVLTYEPVSLSSSAGSESPRGRAVCDPTPRGESYLVGVVALATAV